MANAKHEDAVMKMGFDYFGIRFLRLWELITSMKKSDQQSWWN